MSATANGKPAHELKDVRDIAGDNFATGITEHLDDLSAKHRPIARVKILFDLVSLFCGLKQSGDSPNLDFWLREYKITEVDTPVTYELLERKESRAVGGGLSLRLEVDGGISLRAVVRRLRAGSAETLRDVVLKTRPKADTLAWTIAVPGWQIPGDVEDADQPLPADLPDKQLGTSILARSAIYANEWNPADRESYWPVVTPQPLASSKPRVELTPGLPWRASPGQIGGVMLCNTARVQGLANPDRVAATIDPASGSFALIVSGQKVKVAQTDLRKFITALWAVYFGSEDPGISIDPISAESDHQLVRIIGQIADTDLARVLLDADYYMKQCAVGAQRPAVSGFRNVDELTGKKGLRHLGASRRFWFVPEAMSFRLCGGALVFEGGRMTLKTEYVFLRDKRAQAEPADQEFAAFWTKHYWDFAAVNPVYEELYDYARYVALAKYLKQSGANLQWFLLANRHLVLEKETPGAVPTLRAPSRVLKGARWIGGVDLAVDMSPTQPGRYHLDATATVAIRQALARRTAGGVPATAPTSRETSFSRLGNEPLTARLADGAYTIAPAVSLAGSSMGGSTVFHTDLAARSKGEPGIELIRYNKAGGGDGLFGRNWDLYLPYGLAAANGSGKIKAADVPILAADDKVVKASLYVPEKFVVTDRLDGSTETLVFNKEHFDTVAWVPMDSKSSRFRGMTALNDGSFLLAEKSGCRFRFDQAGRLTDIVFSPDHRTSFTYSGDHLASVSDGFGGNVELTYQNNRIARAASGDQFAEYRYLDDDLAFVRYSDGRKLAFIYRPDGSLEEVVAGADRTPRETKPGS